jgi:hypothetical protein
VGSGGVPTENAWGRNWSVAQRTLAHIYTLWIVSRNRFLRETRFVALFPSLLVKFLVTFDFSYMNAYLIPWTPADVGLGLP